MHKSKVYGRSADAENVRIDVGRSRKMSDFSNFTVESFAQGGYGNPEVKPRLTFFSWICLVTTVALVGNTYYYWLVVLLFQRGNS